MIRSPKTSDQKAGNPLEDALDRLERSVANRESARIPSLVDSKSEGQGREGNDSEEKATIDTDSSFADDEIMSFADDGILAGADLKLNRRKRKNIWLTAGMIGLAQLGILTVAGLAVWPELKAEIVQELMPLVDSRVKAETVRENELGDRLKSIDLRLDDLSSELKGLTQRVDVSPEEIFKEVDFLRERNKLLGLGDVAIYEADRVALDQLMKVVKESPDQKIRSGAASEILRVKFAYMNGVRSLSHPIAVGQLFPSLRGKSELDLKTDQLIELLNDSETHAGNRVKAAYLLADRRDSKAADALAKVVADDLNLDVVREAMMSFSEMTGYRSDDILDAEGLVVWWKENSKRVKIALSN